MRHQWILGLLLVFVAGFTTAIGSAQAPAVRAVEDKPVDPASDPYLRELVRRSRGTNEMLATSITDALRLKLDDLASQFLVSLAARNPNDAELAVVTRQISSGRLLRVIQEDAFTPEAKTQAEKMLRTLQAVDESPPRLEAAISRLAEGGSVDDQLAALRTLVAGGNASIAALSVAASKDGPAQTRDELLRVLLRFGDAGNAALAQLAIYGNESVRAGALASLIRMRADAALPIAVATVHDAAATAAEKRVAADWLLRLYPELPTRADAESFLAMRLADQRHQVSTITESDSVVDLWTIREDAASVMATRVAVTDAAWRGTADTARLLSRVGGLSPESIQAGMAAELAYQYRIDDLFADSMRQTLAEVWGEDAVSAEGFVRLIGDTIQRGDLTATVAALELIDARMADNAGVLMTTHSDIPTSLVDAASHPQPRVRFQAAEAISRLGFAERYAGSSTVMQRWLEMTSLAPDPLVILVENRLELVAQIEQRLSAMGYRVEVVHSVEEAIQTIDLGGDVRFVVSTTILPDRSSLEMVDLIRRRPLGHDIPIILHGPIDRGVDVAINSERWFAPVVYVELPNTVAGWSLVLGPLRQTRLLEPLSAIERLEYRAAGVEALGKIASDGDKFAFYDFDRMVGVEATTTFPSKETSSVAFGQPILAVLSVAGSRDAQSKLVESAIRESSTTTQRDQAVEALTRSFKRDGVLLAGEDLRRLIDATRSGAGKSTKSVERIVELVRERLDETYRATQDDQTSPTN